MVVRLDRSEAASLVRSADAVTAALARATESVASRLDLVLSDPALPEDLRSLLDSACRDGRRARALVDDLRDVMTVGVSAAEHELCDLAEIAQEVLAMLWPRALPRQRRFTFVGDGAVVIAGDRRRLRKALHRLVQHALERSLRGTTIGLELTAARLAISYESDDDPSVDGLALTFADAVARAHGGYVSAAADAGTITLSFAVAPAREAAAAA